MYTYYMFAAMGPQYQRFLWWKKYLTALQMVNFFRILFFNFLIQTKKKLLFVVFDRRTHYDVLKRFIIYLSTLCLCFILGTIRCHYGSRLPTLIYRLQLSKSICLVDRYACRYVLLPLQRILQIHIQSETRPSK